MEAMDQKQFDDYMKKIEEFVIDEGQIVTYKWLSRCLGIHVNTSKQLLHSFLSTHGKSYGVDISASHEISGVRKDGSHWLLLVSDSQLQEARLSLVDIWSEHVYSVQKMKAISDFQLLYAVDPLESTSAFTNTSITCKECVEKSEGELRPVPVAPTEEPKISKNTQAPLVSKKSDSKPVKEKKSTVESKEEGPQGKDEAVEEVTKKVTQVKIDAKDKPAQKKPNSITSMFSAQNQKAKSSKVAENKVEKSEKGVEKQAEIERPEAKKSAVGASKKSNKVKTKKNLKSNREQDSKEKKRKRIRVFSDSDDSEEGSDKERCPSPEPEPEPESTPQLDIGSDQEDEEKKKPSTSAEGSATHKRKKRKIVDKLVMTDEGYMETTKEVLFETDSEPEPEPAKPTETKKTPPKTAKSETAKKPVSPKKGKGKASDGRKQASLLSFFKKT